MKNSTLPDRFWARVTKAEHCWTWTGNVNSKGYGTIYLDGRGQYVHRAAWADINGPIPAGALLDHTFHNRTCVNPDHLRLATNKQNMENLSGPSPRSRSGVRGVSWSKAHSRWRGDVKHNGKTHYVGMFNDIHAAETAVTAKRNELFTHNDADRHGEAVSALCLRVSTPKSNAPKPSSSTAHTDHQPSKNNSESPKQQ